MNNPDNASFKDLLFYVGLPFVQPDSFILDVGNGNGEYIAPFVCACPDDIRFHLIESDENALREARTRFEGDTRINYTQAGYSRLNAFCTDICRCSLALCIGVAPLARPMERGRVLRSIYHSLMPGGVLIFADRVSPWHFGELFGNIKNAKLASAGMQTQVQDNAWYITDTCTDYVLRNCGFNNVDSFYRYLDFQAWIAVK